MFFRCPRPILFNIYINNLLDRRECTLSRVTSDEAGERDLLVAWRVGLLFKGTLASRKSRPMGTSGSLNVSNAKSLHPGQNNSMQQCKQGTDCTGSSSAEKGAHAGGQQTEHVSARHLIAMKADYCSVLKRP